MFTEEEAKKLECPYKDKKCVTDECMAWDWFSRFSDVAYENASIITEKRRKELKELGYIELPAHGGGLALKELFPMTEEEKTKAASNAFGNQLFFGLLTDDKSKWYGHCSCLTSGGE